MNPEERTARLEFIKQRAEEFKAAKKIALGGIVTVLDEEAGERVSEGVAVTADEDDESGEETPDKVPNSGSQFKYRGVYDGAGGGDLTPSEYHMVRTAGAIRAIRF
jgi:hypothetical protein